MPVRQEGATGRFLAARPESMLPVPLFSFTCKDAKHARETDFECFELGHFFEMFHVALIREAQLPASELRMARGGIYAAVPRADGFSVSARHLARDCARHIPEKRPWEVRKHHAGLNQSYAPPGQGFAA